MPSVSGLTQKATSILVKYLEDGDWVEKGQVLLTLDSTALVAQEKSLQQVRQTLAAENQFYARVIDQSPRNLEAQLERLKLNQEIRTLVRNRVTLVAENHLFEAKFNQDEAQLDSQQLTRWRVHQAELQSRQLAARLKIQQLQAQLNHNQVALANAHQRLTTEQQVLAQLSPLAASGAVARLQQLRQAQEVDNHLAEVEKLRAEQQRLRLAIAEAESNLANTVAGSEKELLNRMAENHQRIAEIDSHMNSGYIL